MKRAIIGFSCLLSIALTSNVAAFDQAHLQKLKATNQCQQCDLVGADLTKAKLQGADLTGANLEGASFEGANLSRANLTSASLVRTKFGGAILSGANLNKASFLNADCRGAHLKGADMTEAYLEDTDFSGANLENANMTKAYLEATNLQGVNLSGVNLTGAYLEGIMQATMTNGLTSSDNNSAGGAGAVYVYKRSGSTWAQESYIKAANNNAGDYFGYSVSIDNGNLAIGAYEEDSNQNTITNGTSASSNNSNENPWAVYVYSFFGK